MQHNCYLIIAFRSIKLAFLTNCTGSYNEKQTDRSKHTVCDVDAQHMGLGIIRLNKHFSVLLLVLQSS